MCTPATRVPTSSKILLRSSFLSAASIFRVFCILVFNVLLSANVSANGAISFGQTVTGAINQDSNRQDIFRFEGYEGDLIRITMRRTSQCLETHLKLIAPDGDQVGHQDDIGDRKDCDTNGGDSILHGVRLPKTGTYTIVAAGYWLVDGRRPQAERRYNNGGYRLALTLLSGGSKRREAAQAKRLIAGNKSVIDANGYRVNVPHGLQTITISSIWHTDCATIGSVPVCAIPPIMVVNIGGWVEQGVGFCFPRRGKMLFMPSHDESGVHIVWNNDPAPLPRDIGHRVVGNETCTKIYRAGKLVLVSSSATVDSQPGDPRHGGAPDDIGSHPVLQPTVTPSPTPARSNSPLFNVCDLPTQLRLGGTATREYGANSSLRSHPTIQGKWLGRVAGGTIVAVQAGPIYSENYTWYQVRVPDLDVGWVAESGRAFEECVYFFRPGNDSDSTLASQSAAAAIRYGQTVGGSLDDSAPFRGYTFEASAGDIIDVEFLRTSGDLDPRIQIWDENSNLVVNEAGSSSRGTAFVKAYALPQSGRYELQAHRDDGVGNFTVTLRGNAPTLTPTPTPGLTNGTISSGTFVTGWIGGGSAGEWRFSAEQGDRITLIAQRINGDFIPVLRLYDSNGNLLLEDLNAGSSRVTSLNDDNADGGVYIVSVGRRAGDSGNYSLALHIEEAAARELIDREISAGDSVIAWRNNRSDVDFYRFSAAADQVINISVSRASGNLEPQVFLLQEDGSPLAGDFNIGGSASASIGDVSAPYSGPYTIMVDQNCCAGDYSLSLQIITPARASRSTSA